jgi:hypothetical protein
MPDSHIPEEVRDLLAGTRYGVSFPEPSGCQMRFIQDGVDFGEFFSCRQYGGVRQAVQSAIEKNKELRERYGRKPDGKPKHRIHRKRDGTTGVVGVSGALYYDKRRDTWAFRYQSSWRRKGKPQSKTFHLSKDATPDQLLHGLRTAVQFRKEWELMAEDFDPVRYQQWRVRRLYDPGEPLLPAGFWGDS